MARQRLHINVQLFGCDHQICQVLTGQAAQQADLQDITWSLPLLALIYQISDTQYTSCHSLCKCEHPRKDLNICLDASYVRRLEQELYLQLPLAKYSFAFGMTCYCLPSFRIFYQTYFSPLTLTLTLLFPVTITF